MSILEPERLRLVNVTKRFSGVVALKEVSLNVRRLETLGLVGENGAGKSTLLDIVCGVRQPDSGEIVLDGVPRAFAASFGGVVAWNFPRSPRTSADQQL